MLLPRPLCQPLLDEAARGQSSLFIAVVVVLFASCRGCAKLVTVIVFLIASCRGCAKFDSSSVSFVYGNLAAYYLCGYLCILSLDAYGFVAHCSSCSLLSDLHSSAMLVGAAIKCAFA